MTVILENNTNETDVGRVQQSSSWTGLKECDEDEVNTSEVEMFLPNNNSRTELSGNHLIK